MSRLPFAAGADRLLPAAFARLHPRWHTPHVSILTLGVVASFLLIAVQLGDTLRAAYDVLVSLMIITGFIPYLYIFGSSWKAGKSRERDCRRRHRPADDSLCRGADAGNPERLALRGKTGSWHCRRDRLGPACVPASPEYNQGSFMSSPVTARPKTSHVRWTVCALLFFATTINYVDRQVLSILAKTLETTIGWDSIQYGYITSAFQAAYGLGLLGAGRVMDRLGTRKGFAIAITVWSIAAMSHAAATTAFTFGLARAFLGFGEAANFPACIKTVAEWFPKKERAHATGIFNSGANIGAVIVPLVVPWMAEQVRMAVGIYRDRRARLRLADLLAGHLSQARRASHGLPA